jgi:hypothetical protein
MKHQDANREVGRGKLLQATPQPPSFQPLNKSIVEFSLDRPEHFNLELGIKPVIVGAASKMTTFSINFFRSPGRSGGKPRRPERLRSRRRCRICVSSSSRTRYRLTTTC